MSSYLAVLQKYAQFSGRARRQEYWMFALFNIIISVVLNILAQTTDSTVFSIIAAIYALATLLPALAVAVRRLHDTNHSGAWFLIILIPLIGAIWLLVLVVTAGDRGPNQYGPDPKA